MPEIIFPTHVTTAKALFEQELDVLEVFLEAKEHRGTLFADAPYCLPGAGSPHPDPVLTHLRHIPEVQRPFFTRALDDFGDAIVAFGELFDRHLADLDLQHSASMVGAGATANGARLNGFQQALVSYQESLLDLNQHKRAGRGDAARKVILERRVRQRYATLQNHFRLELHKTIPAQNVGKNRGNALTSADRGLTLTRRRRSRRLYVADTRQALQLKQMATGIRYSGNGLLVLDAGIRANKVRAVHHQGGDWQREMVMQTTGFGAGAAVGMIVGTGAIGWLTTAGVAMGLGVTPVGWVVLIGIGVGAGFWAGYRIDRVGQDFAASIYDRRL